MTEENTTALQVIKELKEEFFLNQLNILKRHEAKEYVKLQIKAYDLILKENNEELATVFLQVRRIKNFNDTDSIELIELIKEASNIYHTVKG